MYILFFRNIFGFEVEGMHDVQSIAAVFLLFLAGAAAAGGEHKGEGAL
jgi:hypothetical protein